MEFTRLLTAWYADNARTLPWRGERDPYRVWVSEIILQQTRVVQGYQYYTRFLERFPTIEALAAATEREVLSAWQGLGYYSRARNLHAASRQVVAAGGGFPRTLEAVRALPGVGAYTAAAICAFAYNLPHPALDGNAYRVLARYFGIALPIDTAAGRKHFAALSEALIDRKHPARYNQAMMDFGAQQCVPRVPQCEVCPLRPSCQAAAEADPERYPVKTARTKVSVRYLSLVYLTAPGVVYLRRRPAGDIWQGLYEPFVIEQGADASAPPSATEVAQHLLQSVPLAAGTLTPLQRGVRHQLTHRLLVCDFYTFALAAPVTVTGYDAVDESRLAEYPLPRLVSLLHEAALHARRA